ncbi:MAG TPA: cellulase family glycosylhydrolase [Firmicutes bacterium]|nr:cellulase family glycosylhydrolase [Bacillota bacterium]
MKKRKILSMLLTWAVALSCCLPAVQASDDTVREETIGISIWFEGESTTNGGWQQAVSLSAGTDIHLETIRPGSVIAVDYQSEATPELILQSWSEEIQTDWGSGQLQNGYWLKVAPAKIEAGTAYFYYEDIIASYQKSVPNYASYGMDFPFLHILYVGDRGKPLTVTKVSMFPEESMKNLRFVTFNSNGGTPVASVQVMKSERLSVLPEPERKGYLFQGWYTDNKTFQNLFSIDTAIEEDLILYAKWEKDAENFPDDIQDITALELVMDMGLGWNLGNTLDTSGDWLQGSSVQSFETGWGNPVTTAAMIKAVKDAGFNTVRIPVSWGQHMGPAPNYTIDPAWMSRVEEIVGYVLDQGMYAIINAHNDNDWLYPSPEKEADAVVQLEKLWTQVAEHFKDYGDHLIFEVMNEPRLAGTPYEWTGGTPESRQVVNHFSDVAVQAIRAAGGNNEYRYIMVPPYCASLSTETLNDLVLPDDDRLIVSVHSYSPYSFAMDENGTTKWGTASDQRQLVAEFDRVYERYVKRGIPVVIGEFGSINKNNLDQRKIWATYYTQEARRRNIACIWWDNGGLSSGHESFGIFDRRKLQWQYPGLVTALLNGIRLADGIPVEPDDSGSSGNPSGGRPSGGGGGGGGGGGSSVSSDSTSTNQATSVAEVTTGTTNNTEKIKQLAGTGYVTGLLVSKDLEKRTPVTIEVGDAYNGKTIYVSNYISALNILLETDAAIVKDGKATVYCEKAGEFAVRTGNQLGDINGDDKITLQDLMLALNMYKKGSVTASMEGMAAAALDGNSTDITLRDLMVLMNLYRQSA